MPAHTDPREDHFYLGIFAFPVGGTMWQRVVCTPAGQLLIAFDELQAATPALYNVTMTLANTEYSRALPANTRKFTIKCRTLYHIKLAFTALASGTTYLTIPSGMAYSEDLIQPATLTLYFQCPTAAQVAEIVAWS